jgi:NADH:ubiquinone oxidoreductase subunit 3 (subunit A)
MGSWVLTTPVVFVIVLALMLVLLRALGAMKLTVETPHGSGKGKAYACGEDIQEHRIQPDYRQFFPFAFFFTIMHVFALVVATVPASQVTVTGVGLFYCISLVIGLFVLFRK